MTQKWLSPLLIVTMILSLMLSQARTTHADEGSWPEDDAPGMRVATTNLVVNGDFEQLPFYWRYPNHYVAGGWMRWWINGSVLPEYVDTDGSKYSPYEGSHGQGYFKWGSTYIAGIYQIVSGLTPCRPYRLTAWGKGHGILTDLPGTRIGLDTMGTQLTLSDEDSAVHGGLPSSIVWSPEQTVLFTWQEFAVQAVPTGDRLTVVLYAAPWRYPDSESHYFDTYWDLVTMVPASFTGDRLPLPIATAPSSLITNIVSSTASGSLTINWNTTSSAFSQVWYTVFTPTVPLTPSTPLSYTMYLPLAARGTHYSFDAATAIDMAPSTSHQATITGLSTGQRVRFAILAHRLYNSSCVTEASSSFLVDIDD